MSQIEDRKIGRVVVVEKWSPAESGRIILNWGSKSKAIRGLFASGESVANIARMLNIRYQHVRNVSAAPLKREIKKERELLKQVQAQKEGGS